MTRTLVVGDPVITLGTQTAIEDGALIVDGRTVEHVGSRAELAEMGSFDRVIGSPDHIVMPGFVNGHFHSGGPASQGMAQYIFERANVHVHGNRAPLTEEDLYHATLMSLIRCIRGGQTAIIDFNYGRPGMAQYGWPAILRAYEALGMRAALGVVTRDENIYVHGENEAFLATLPPSLADEIRASPMGYAWPVDDVLAAYEELVKEWDGRDGRIRVILAPDWTPACSDALYRRNRELANTYATGVTTHVLETRSEMIYNLKRYGRTAMRRLADIGLLGPDVSCAHFVWATDEDIAILRDTGAVAVNNPGSNLRLSTGIARVRDMLDANARVMFGTDSISFSEHEDFFQELRLAAYLQRTPGDLAVGRLDTATVLRAAASNGARAVRFERQLGSLEPGREADLLVLKRDRIFWPKGKFDRMPVLDVLIDRANATDLESVMIAGRLVLDAGRIATVDERKTEAALEEAAAERMYVASDEVLRWRELGIAVEAYMFDFYKEWSAIPVQPAYVYNARNPPTLQA